MSRIGRKSIPLPKGVTVTERDRHLEVTGPRGSLGMELNPCVSIRRDGDVLSVERSSDDREARALHGLMRNLLANLVTGVSTGFERRLDIVGVGFKAEVANNRLNLALGYSHPVIFEIPKGIDISVEKQTKIVVRGMDAQQVGQVAAVIKNYRLPDPYKAKGIRYENEVIKVKAGKTGSK
jgi:large subunit ribosomal protein L6